MCAFVCVCYFVCLVNCLCGNACASMNAYVIFVGLKYVCLFVNICVRLLRISLDVYLFVEDITLSKMSKA